MPLFGLLPTVAVDVGAAVVLVVVVGLVLAAWPTGRVTKMGDGPGIPGPV